LRTPLDPGGLCEEFASLRQIVWKPLKDEDPSVQSAVERILRFDHALSIVTKAPVVTDLARILFPAPLTPAITRIRPDRAPRPRVA